MSSVKKKITDELNNGKSLFEATFKLGFLACIESIQDKGYEELAKILEKERQKI